MDRQTYMAGFNMYMFATFETLCVFKLTDKGKCPRTCNTLMTKLHPKPLGNCNKGSHVACNLHSLGRNANS
jgi:hypothetical protein